MSEFDHFKTTVSAECGKALGRPMSRRFFFSLSAVVGALTLKGSLFGGTLQAWADEADRVHFVVYILSKYEVPVMAYDVSTATPTPLAGCKVTIHSWYAQEEVVVVTDDAGFAPANVKDLSFQRDDETSPVYNFWAAVTLEKDGYRQYYDGYR